MRPGAGENRRSALSGPGRCPDRCLARHHGGGARSANGFHDRPHRLRHLPHQARAPVRDVLHDRVASTSGARRRAALAPDVPAPTKPAGPTSGEGALHLPFMTRRTSAGDINGPQSGNPCSPRRTMHNAYMANAGPLGAPYFKPRHYQRDYSAVRRSRRMLGTARCRTRAAWAWSPAAGRNGTGRPSFHQDKSRDRRRVAINF